MRSRIFTLPLTIALVMIGGRAMAQTVSMSPPNVPLVACQTYEFDLSYTGSITSFVISTQPGVVMSAPHGASYSVTSNAGVHDFTGTMPTPLTVEVFFGCELVADLFSAGSNSTMALPFTLTSLNSAPTSVNLGTVQLEYAVLTFQGGSSQASNAYLFNPNAPTTTYTRVLEYQNNGSTLGTFQGAIRFTNSDDPTAANTDCANYTHVDIAMMNPSGTLSSVPSTFLSSVNGYTVTAALTTPLEHLGLLRVTETFELTDCLALACDRNVRLEYGCDVTSPDLCCTPLSCPQEEILFTRSPQTYQLSVVRNAPADIPDPTCYDDTREWEYTITNTGTAPVFDAWVELINEPDAHTILTSVTVTGPQGGVVVTSTTQLAAPGSCSALQSFVGAEYNIPALNVGEALQVELETRRCCPVDPGQPMLLPLFNQETTFNQLRLRCGASNDCSDPLPTSSIISPPGTFSGFNGLSFNFSSGLPVNDLNWSTAILPSGPTDMSAPANACGDIGAFEMETILFMDQGARDLDMIMSMVPAPTLSGRVRVELLMDGGLQVSPALAPMHFTRANCPLIWNASTTTITNGAFAFDGANTYQQRVIADFDLADLAGITVACGTGANAVERAIAYIRGAVLQFQMQACCINAEEPFSRYVVNTYLLPGLPGCTGDCSIPMASTADRVNVHCPGCRVPGGLATDFTIERTTFGFEDANDDGLCDGATATPITTPVTSMRLDRSMAGDELRAVFKAEFVEGDTWPLSSLGFPLNQLYIEQRIPWGEDQSILSNASQLELLTATLTIDSGTVAETTLTFVQGSSPNQFDVDPSIKFNDIFFFAVHPGNPALAGLQFTPGQQYRLETTYRVARNFQPPNAVNFGVNDVQHSSRISNHLYFSGAAAPYTVPVFGTATHASQAQPPTTPAAAEYIYFCEAWDGRHAFLSIDETVAQQWQNGAQVGPLFWQDDPCQKEMRMVHTVRIGGGLKDWFPNEFRPAPGTPQLFHLELPPYTGSAPYAPLSAQVSSRVRSNLPGGFGFTTFQGPEVLQTAGVPPFTNVGLNAWELDLHGPPGGATLEAFGPFPWVTTDAQCAGACGTGNTVAVPLYPLPMGDGFAETTVQVRLDHTCSTHQVDPVVPAATFSFFPDQPFDPVVGTTLEHAAPDVSLPNIFTTALYLPTLAVSLPQGNSVQLDVATTCIEVDLRVVPDQTTFAVQNAFIQLNPPAGLSVVSVAYNGVIVTDVGNGLYMLGELANLPPIQWNHVVICVQLRTCADQTLTIDYGYRCDPTGTAEPADMAVCFEDHVDFDIFVTQATLVSIPGALVPTGFGHCEMIDRDLCFVAPFGPVQDLELALDVPPGTLLTINSIELHLNGTATTVPVGTTMYPPGYHLVPLNSLLPSALVMSNGDVVCVVLGYLPDCDFDGEIPTCKVRAMAYCGDDLSVAYPPLVLPWNGSDSCRPSCDPVTTCEVVGEVEFVQDPLFPCHYTFSFAPAVPPPSGFTVSYLWTFPDGSTSTDPTPFFNFANGAWSVPLHVTYEHPITGVRCSLDLRVDVIAEGCPTCPRLDFRWDILEDGSYQFHDRSGLCPQNTTAQYTWVFDGTVTTTDPDPIHQFTSTGQHVVCLTVTCMADNGAIICEDEVCLRINNTPRAHAVDPAPGRAPRLELLPNPTTGLFDLRMDVPEERMVQLHIHDGKGRWVSGVSQLVHPGLNRIALDLSQQVDGIYLMRIEGLEEQHLLRIALIR